MGLLYVLQPWPGPNLSLLWALAFVCFVLFSSFGMLVVSGPSLSAALINDVTLLHQLKRSEKISLDFLNGNVTVLLRSAKARLDLHDTLCNPLKALKLLWRKLLTQEIRWQSVILSSDRQRRIPSRLHSSFIRMVEQLSRNATKVLCSTWKLGDC